jgi:hypothetical protein
MEEGLVNATKRRESQDVGRASQEESASRVIGVDDPLDRQERGLTYLVRAKQADHTRCPSWQIGSHGAADWECQRAAAAQMISISNLSPTSIRGVFGRESPLGERETAASA